MEREAVAAWRDLELAWSAATSNAPLPKAQSLRLRRSRELPRGRSGRGRPGFVELRQQRDWVVDEPLVIALRHELAHQFLWAACPAGAEDQLFHEAFAIASSGEAELWSEGTYLSTSAALAELRRSGSLDSRASRRALARLLVESGAGGRALPVPLARRLRQCASGARWSEPMSPLELAAAPSAAGDAFVAISRHSGEVLALEGEARSQMPFGSTLKPFLVAAARARAPLLPVRPERPDWSCGEGLPSRVDVETALLRSCNGYFLDWAARDPGIAGLGAWGPALVELGLSRAPADVTEAIGLRPALTISPLGLANAYRLLAESSPETMELLRQNVRRGTLAGLGTSKRLEGVATKTGTVRDAESRPVRGLIVAVDADLIAVMVRLGKQPRDFAGELATALDRLRRRPGRIAAQVQTFALLEPGDVRARCAGEGFMAAADGPRPVEGERPLAEIVRGGSAVCLGGPWRIRFPGIPEPGRAYEGVFSFSPAPAYQAPAGATVSAKAERARRGSDFIFRTTLALYTAGVLGSEDAAIAGEPRAALARVIAHNVAHSRHPGRPVCDTTHCQVFQGTARPRPGDEGAIGEPAPGRGWLAFSAGGDEPWSESRSAAEVEKLLGTGAFSLRFGHGELTYLRPETSRDGTFEEQVTIACDPFRSALKLPSCPLAASQGDGQYRFEGRGRGHGEGLDVEAARKGGADREQLLRQSYGKP